MNSYQTKTNNAGYPRNAVDAVNKFVLISGTNNIECKENY